ncbi:MAG: aminotransferase, partial [Christensenellaceae bacterium]|nr:aminotransferase [Christensenellaceae bacterium]
IQAGLLHVKLGFMEELNQERREIARRYQEGLDTAFLTLPKVRPGVTSTWHQFVIHSPHRDALKAWLAENGIGSEIHYPIPPHLSEAYRYLGYHEGDFPITEKNAREVLSLPMFNGLREDEQAFVIDTINRFRP